MRSLLADGSVSTDLTDDELVALYQFPYDGHRSWLRAIFISSLDGSAQGTDGASASLSSPGDRRLFSLQRSLCDVVLVGAGTARVERYRPVKPSEVDVALRRRLGLNPVPTIAVVSRSLSLDPALLGPGEAQTIVVTTEDAPTDAVRELTGAKVIRAGSGTVDVAVVLAELARLGHHRVLCEGGPTLLGQIVAADGLDDLCLTTAPLLVGGAAPRILRGPELMPAPSLRIDHLLEEDGSLFARYVVDRPPNPPAR